MIELSPSGILMYTGFTICLATAVGQERDAAKINFLAGIMMMVFAIGGWLL